MHGRAGIAAGLIAVVLVGATLAQAEIQQDGNLRVRFDGDFTPRSLPRERSVPVTVSLEGKISTTDESHPPSLRRFELELNRAGEVSSRGLPTCAASELQSTSSAGARAECGPALVGSGSFAADVASSQTAVPAHGRILVFNAARNGKPALLLHLYGTTPIRATFVLPLKLQRRAKGQFGTVLSTDVPKLAGGVGAITQMSLVIGREYDVQGERRGYINASCAAPAGFPGAPFTLARGKFSFADGRVLTASLSRHCSVRR
jgi:hypothetical protein